MSTPVELAAERWPTLDAALDAEWLVTNGLGGYASATVSGANTRRYHGLLVAALKPPVGRTVLLSKLEEELEVRGVRYPLSTNEYHDGTINPVGWPLLHSMRFHETIPTFVFNAGGAVVEKTVWMARERNTTYVRYTMRKTPAPAILYLRPLVTHRDYHHLTQGSRDWRFAVRRDATGACEVRAHPDAATLRLWTRPSAEFHEGPDWYWRFLYRRERERGLDCLEDLYMPGVFRATLKQGESLTVIASAESPANVDMNTSRAWEAEMARQGELLRRADATVSRDAFAARLALAADQFLVARPQAGQDGRTVIAGYHWFGDWGRDTLIALPGLCLPTGRWQEARAILRTFARYADQGMLPNRFPDSGEPPEYTSVDAALWYFVALDAYLRATRDDDLLRELFSTLEGIVAGYRRGTRCGIGVDTADGLLRAGATDMALTWMDACVDGWVVTPRWGKAVEINALWYNALTSMAEWSGKLGRDIQAYLGPAATARESFNKRFWYGQGGYLYDVVDGEEGDDPSLRPNQLFAISLPHAVLEQRRWAPTLEAVRSKLLTPVGLRTLAPGHPRYAGRYVGDQHSRDAAYHQGTVWPWLLGAYTDALLRVEGEQGRVAARKAIEGMRTHLWEAGLGALSEIFEGDAPHAPRGCIAQAWSVAEVLRAWLRTSGG